MKKEWIKTCEELCSLIAPSGYEAKVSSYIRNALERNNKGYFSEDMMGNIVFSFYGEKKKAPIALIAHMDSAGIFTTTDEQDRFCKFGSLSKYNKDKANNQLFKFLSGAEAIMDYDHRVVKRQGNISLHKGDFGAFAPSFERTTKELLGTFLDDRVICALMLGIISNMIETERTIMFVFTVQEEIGNKGAKALVSHLDADYVLVLDTTVCDTQKMASVPIQGNGVCLKICDGSGICSYALNKKILEIAEKSNISVQLELLDFAGSDIAAFSGTRNDCLFTGLSIPCSNMHSSRECMNLNDIESFDVLLHRILEEICNAKFED